MNSFAILFLSFLVLAAGYIFYAKVLERFFGIDPANITPARKYYDGVDYVPARNWLVLFNHHFASIAGAGPIVGPVIAVAIWGWGPAILWILLGTVLIGGLHDFAAIVVSIRHRARSIADIADDVISRRSKVIFLAFVWFALVLVIAVFASVCARTLTADPKIVIPSFALIGVALVVGFMLYRMKLNIVFTTVCGIALLVFFMFLGNRLPVSIPGNAVSVWITLLLVYAFIASVTPVQILLQPRDYMSSFLLYFGILAGCIGISLSRPVLNIPLFGNSGINNIGWLWPMLFVTVACGANSGFHSLVSSGTTSKQLPNERYARRIGYGAMALEGFLAVIALLAVAAGLKSGELSTLLGSGGAGPIAAFGKGYGRLTSSILSGNGSVIAIMILNTFILTTLDTATRICRYLSEELFKIKNRFFSTFVVIFTGGFFALSGSWQKIWPMFGASNQLVAALTFVVISSWLLCRGKSLRYTFLPLIFMLVTATAAIVYQLVGFIAARDLLMSGVAIVLLILSATMVYDVVMAVKKKKLKCRIL